MLVIKIFLFTILIFKSLFAWSKAVVDLQSLLERTQKSHPDNFLFEQRLHSISAMRTGEVYLPSPMLSFGTMNTAGMNPMKEEMWEFRQKIPFVYKTYLSRSMLDREFESINSEWQQNQRVRQAQLTTEFYRWLGVQQKLKHRKDQEVLLTQLIAVQRTRYISQKVTQVELVALQIERGNLLNEIAALEAELAEQRAKVESLAGPGDSLKDREPKAEKLPLLPLAAWKEESIPEYLERNNAELKALELMRDKNDLSVSRSRAGWVPDFEVMLSFRRDDVGDEKKTWQVGIEIPLWFAGEQRGRVGQARAESSGAQTRFQEQKRQLVLEAESQLKKRVQLRRQLDLMENGLVQWSSQNVQSARTAYQTGKLEYAGFLALMQSSFQTLLAYEDLKVSVLENQERLKLMLGGH